MSSQTPSLPKQPWQLNTASELASLSGDELVAKKRAWVEEIERNKLREAEEVRDLIARGYRQDDEGRWELGLQTPRRLKLPMADRERLYERQVGICGICNTAMFHINVCHADHIIPLALGGPDVIDNIHLVHASCNLKKGASAAS